MTTLYALHAEHRQTVAHIAHVEPQADESSTWPTDSDRRYLCGRTAPGPHTRSFPWSHTDEYPTCKRCRTRARQVAP